MDYWKINDAQLARCQAEADDVKDNWSRIQHAIQNGLLSTLTTDDRAALASLVSTEIERNRKAFVETRLKRVINALFENRTSHLDPTRNFPPKQWWWSDVSLKAWRETSSGGISAELGYYAGVEEVETFEFVFPAAWLDKTDDQLHKLLQSALAREDARQPQNEGASAAEAVAEAQRRLRGLRGNS